MDKAACVSLPELATSAPVTPINKILNFCSLSILVFSLSATFTRKLTTTGSIQYAYLKHLFAAHGSCRFSRLGADHQDWRKFPQFGLIQGDIGYGIS